MKYIGLSTAELLFTLRDLRLLTHEQTVRMFRETIKKSNVPTSSRGYSVMLFSSEMRASLFSTTLKNLKILDAYMDGGIAAASVIQAMSVEDSFGQIY